MGTIFLVAVPLLATIAFILLSEPTVAAAGFIQASPELTEFRNCDGQPCLMSLLRQKRQDTASADPAGDGAAPADAPPPEGAPAGPTADPAGPTADPAGPTAGPAGAPASPASGGGPAAPPAASLGEIPLPPVTQQMPNLPPNFPYPDVKVVQEVPIPTKPRKKLLPAGGANPYPFPPIGPPADPVSPPMEVPTNPPMEVPTNPPMQPASPVEQEPEPVGPIEPVRPIEREPYPTPVKPDCKPGGGYGPPQDWRFPKARGHKKCPPSTNSAMGNEANYATGNEVVNAAPEDVRVNLRTVERDEEAGAGGHTTVHPGGKGSATSTVCSMGTVLFAMVAYFLNVAI